MSGLDSLLHSDAHSDRRSRPRRETASERLAADRRRRTRLPRLVDDAGRHLCRQVYRRHGCALVASSLLVDCVPDVLGKGQPQLPVARKEIEVDDADEVISLKLIWAQITAQTFMAPYAGDQIFSTVQRIIGTGESLSLPFGGLRIADDLVSASCRSRLRHA